MLSRDLVTAVRYLLMTPVQLSWPLELDHANFILFCAHSLPTCPPLSPTWLCSTWSSVPVSLSCGSVVLLEGPSESDPLGLGAASTPLTQIVVPRDPPVCHSPPAVTLVLGAPPMSASALLQTDSPPWQKFWPSSRLSMGT